MTASRSRSERPVEQQPASRPDGASPAGCAGRPARTPRIALRRFAGPAAHVGRFSRPVRVAHLTDLHVGRVTPFEVQLAAVELANAQRPDLVVLTGDFVCHSQLFLDDLREIVRSFAAPVAAVLGNHDHWSGAPEVRRTLRQAGAAVLDNAHTTLSIGSDRLQIVGLDDAYTGNADRERALRGLRPDVPALALSHIGEEAEGLWARGVPLVLSGHTHGGQVTLAGLHELAVGRLGGHRYVHGLYGDRRGRREPGAVYVGAGIGAAVMPLRLGDRGRREVALFELGVEPGSFAEHHEEQQPLPGRPPTPRLTALRAAKVERKRQRRERARRADSARPPRGGRDG